VDFEEITVATDRLDFPALAAGSGPPVVCWHGFPDHPATFGPLAEHLVAAGRRVIAPFLRGHHPATIDAVTYTDGITLAADAAAIGATLAGDSGSAEGVDMIGHDIGAGVVQRVAAAWPEVLRRGVTLSVPPPPVLASLFTDPAQQKRSFYIWLFQLDGIAETILTADRALIDYLWTTWSPDLTLDDEYRRLIHSLYGDPDIIRNALRVYRANFNVALHDPALSHLAEKTESVAPKPLMLLAGANDGCIAATMFTDAGLAPGSRVEIIPGTGHFLHLEQPATIANLALRWFAE
jgi:pimeloyl-ACP methyl ester carboxylesterase